MPRLPPGQLGCVGVPQPARQYFASGVAAVHQIARDGPVPAVVSLAESHRDEQRGPGSAGRLLCSQYWPRPLADSEGVEPGKAQRWAGHTARDSEGQQPDGAVMIDARLAADRLSGRRGLSRGSARPPGVLSARCGVPDHDDAIITADSFGHHGGRRGDSAAGWGMRPRRRLRVRSDDPSGHHCRRRGGHHPRGLTRPGRALPARSPARQRRNGEQWAWFLRRLTGRPR